MRYLIAFLIWMMACPVWAGSNPYVLGSIISSTPSCSSTIQSFTNAPTASSIIGYLAVYTYIGQQFTASSTTTICAFSANIKKINSGQSITGYLADDDGSDNPLASSLVECSTVSSADIPSADYGYILFSCPDKSITSTNKYFIILKSGGISTTNYTDWGRASVNGLIKNDSDATGTWTTTSTTRTNNYVIYGY